VCRCGCVGIGVCFDCMCAFWVTDQRIEIKI